MPANHCMPHTNETKEKLRIAKIGKAAVWKHREHYISGGVELWKCGVCSQFFPKEGFYKNKRTLLGITYDCRKCHTAISMETRNPDLTRKRHKEFAQRERKENPEKFRERERVASLARPKNEKYRARYLLNSAVRTGRLQKPSVCSHCGELTKITAHHHDYSLPLDVVWLCYQCHADLERGVWCVSFRKVE